MNYSKCIIVLDYIAAHNFNARGAVYSNIWEFTYSNSYAYLFTRCFVGLFGVGLDNGGNGVEALASLQ